MTDPEPKRKPGRPKGSTANKVSKSGSIIKNRPKTAKARLDGYLDMMPMATLNDITLLENMVAIELEMDRLRNSMPDEKSGLEARKISEALSNYSKEYRLIQDALGIGRNQRSTEIDMQKEVDRLVAESTELVDKVGVKIQCKACVSDFEMGLILFHFKDEVPWVYVFACPKCGIVNQIMGIMEFPKVPEGEHGPTDQKLIVDPGVPGIDGNGGGDAPDRDRDSGGQILSIPEPSL